MTGYRFLPDALAELEDAAVSYETRQPGLGLRVWDEFDSAIRGAQEFLQAAPLVRDAPERYGLRWMLLASFPVKVVYAVRSPTDLIVVAVFHAARRPGYWTRRIKDLGK